MNTIETLYRLADQVSDRSPAELPINVQTRITQAVNSGIQKFFRMAPPKHRQTELSFELKAPLEISLGITKDSNLVTGHTFTAEQMYQTVRIEGDLMDNQVIAENALLHPVKVDTGTVDAKIYFDALAPDQRIQKAITEPILVNAAGKEIELRRIEDRSVTSGVRWNGWWSHNTNTLSCRSTGTPHDYRFEPIGSDKYGQPDWMLRVDPIPIDAWRGSIEIECAPPRYSWKELLSPTLLPMSEEWHESVLIPFIEGDLASSKFWINEAGRQYVRASVVEAERVMATIPIDMGHPENRRGTPIGY